MLAAQTPWNRLCRVVGLALLVGLPATALAAQVTLLDETTVGHTEASAPAVSRSVGGAVPDDLSAPVDFAGGTVHYRVDVTNTPAAMTTGYQLCLVQGANRACSDGVSFSASGEVEASQALSGFTGIAALDLTMALDAVALVVTDAAGIAVDASDTSWAGAPDLSLYYPLDASVEAVLVDAGASFEGYPSEQTPVDPNAGLRGRYYDNTDFTELVETRNDAPIDFHWESDAPPFEPLGGGWSILWTGQIEPQYSGTFTFCTVNDDGVRLWIDDQLVVDDWNNHGPQEHCGAVNGLQNGQPVDVWLEYYNGAGPGSIQLLWESDEQPKEVIPGLYLTPNSSASGTQLTLLGGPADGEVFEHATEAVRLDVRRRGDIDQALSVDLEIGGDATAGVDFEVGSMRVEFAPGELAATVELTMIDDLDVEGDETITVTLAQGDYTLSPPSSVSFTLIDNDADNFGITGEVVYTGAASGPIIVEAFRDQDQAFQKLTTTIAEAGSFQIDGALEGLYTIIAFIDANDNRRLDADERWNAHRDDQGAITRVSLPPTATGILIDLDQEPAEAKAPSAGDGSTDEGCGCMASGSSSPPLGVLLVLSMALLYSRRRRPSEI